MIKVFCDCCGSEITENSKTHGGTIGRLGATLRRGGVELQVEVLTSKDKVSNAGDFCKYCVIDALNKLDDRPRKARQ